MADINKLLEIRKAMKAKKPHFKRQDWHKKKRLPSSWRKPKGMDSKLRRHMHGHGHMPNPGYRGPALVRGMHKSGLVPILISTVSQLDGINGKTHGIIVGSNVGIRKRVEIATKAQAKSIRILNIKDSAKFVQQVKDDLAKRKHAKTSATKVEAKPAPKAEAKPAQDKTTSTNPDEKKETERREAEKVITSRQ